MNEEIGLPEPLNNPQWSDEENRQWETWVNSGTKTAGQATAEIENARRDKSHQHLVEREAESEPQQIASQQIRYQTAGEQRRQRVQEIQANLEVAGEENKARQAEAEQAIRQRTVQLLKETKGEEV